jgi:putative ABC transport system permease protein
MMFRIALRNIFRNRRRSLMTAALVGMGSLAMLLFGGFVANIFLGLETGFVQNTGHLQVYRSGYFLFGPGNPAAYGIDDHQALMKDLVTDPVLAPMIAVITPSQSMVGIAGNFSNGISASKTFFGIGVVGADREAMRKWNPYNAGLVRAPDDRLNDPASNRAVIGRGVARILGLCAPLHVPDCPALEVPSQPATADKALDPALADLANAEQGAKPDPNALPHIDVLSATAGGAPNIVGLDVAGVDVQTVKEIDDNYVAMPLGVAQQLVYGRGPHKITALTLQLHNTKDIETARARLGSLIAERHLPLEVRDFKELNPFYVQVRGMFSVMFIFLTLIMGIIVLFAVVNTMTMNVMERTAEIGTIRAMGVRRSGIRRQFLLEGAFLGLVGSTLGVILAFAGVWLINHGGFRWQPPGNTYPIPFTLAWPTNPALLFGAWFGLVLVATLATIPPSNKAAKSRIVDALRHV